MEKTHYSALYRVIHWTIALAFTLLLITIFLRNTWLNKHHVAEIIQNQFVEIGQPLSSDQALSIAKKIRQPMWQWHIYLGYTLTALFGLRFLLPLFGRMKFQNPFDTSLSIKDKFKNLTYLLFYACVCISLVTGLLLQFGPKQYKEPVEDIHVLGIYYLIAFIAVHLTGVLTAEFTRQKGIVSAIISGNRKKG